jgi:hypothetical protein
MDKDNRNRDLNVSTKGEGAATAKEITGNDYNLNFSCYVQTREAEETVEIEMSNLLAGFWREMS